LINRGKCFVTFGLILTALLLHPITARALPPDADADGVPDSTDNCINVVNPSQTDTDCDTYGNACDGDFNQDLAVTPADAALFDAAKGGTNPLFDLNEPPDGAVDATDEAIFLALLVTGAPGPSSGVLSTDCLSCPGDDFADLAMWVNLVDFIDFAGICREDLDGDGVVGLTDVALVIDLVGPCPNGTSGFNCPGDFVAPFGVVDEADVIWVLQRAAAPTACKAVSFVIHGYVPVPDHDALTCGIGFAPLGPVLAVNEIVVVDAATGSPVPGFDFSPSTAASGGFTSASPEANPFVGFVSSAQSISQGLSLDLRILVSVPYGTKFEEIRDAYLGAPGPTSPLSVATDEVDASGNPQGTHQAFRAAASVMQMGTFLPATSPAGLGALAVALVGVGVGLMRMRRRSRVRSGD